MTRKLTIITKHNYSEQNHSHTEAHIGIKRKIFSSTIQTILKMKRQVHMFREMKKFIEGGQNFKVGVLLKFIQTFVNS